MGTRGHSGAQHGRGLAPALVLACLLAAQAARAQEPVRIPVRYGVQADSLTVSFDVSERFGPDFQKRAHSGLTNRILVSVSLQPLDAEGELAGAPLAVHIRQCEVVYDLWGERFGLSLLDGRKRSRRIVATYPQVTEGCGRVDGVPLVALGALDLRRRYVVQVRVDVNPMSEELLERTREYLGDPLGHRRGGEGGGTLFGAVVRIFFRDQPESGERVVRLSGAPFGLSLLHELLDGAEGNGTESRAEQEEE